MRLNSGPRILGAWLLAMVGGCHLIVGIRDAEPYGPDAGAGGGGGEGGGTACSPGQTRDCYSGTEQTADIGTCKSGTQTCNADETWGTCEGEVLPAIEDCSEPEDEDCSGYGCGDTMWVQQFGALSTVTSSGGVGVDSRTGDIYFTGTFSGSLTIGSNNLDSQGEGHVAFLAKFDRFGTPLWAKQFGILNGSNDDEAIGESVVVDGEGNVILIGTASPMVNLGGSDLPEGVFIGKFSPSGDHIWSQGCQSDYFSGNPTAYAHGAVDPGTNDVIIAGSFGVPLVPEPIVCGNAAMLTSMGGGDVFVSRLAASDGSVMYSESFGETGADRGNDVTVDAQGSIFLTGRAGDSLSFGGPPVPSYGGYIAKLASNGSHVWTMGIGSGEPLALALDAAGAIAMTGSGNDMGVLNFGGEDLAPIGIDFELFVARLDASGAHVWSKRFGSPGDNRSIGTDVALDSEGNVAITGYILGNVPIDGVVLAGNGDAFVARFDAGGTSVWSKTFGQPRYYSLAFSPLGELVVGGQADAAVDFGQGIVTPIGDIDLFLLKISP